MDRYAHLTISRYLDRLAARDPVPGGGSAAALTGALGAALISMVANYSLGRKHSEEVERRIKEILRENEKIRKRLLILVDLDAKAYLGVVKTRRAAPKIKQKALSKARLVPLEVCRLCHQAVMLTPFLVEKGNPHLVSDIKVALELLLAAFRSAMVNVEVNR